MKLMLRLLLPHIIMILLASIMIVSTFIFVVTGIIMVVQWNTIDQYALPRIEFISGLSIIVSYLIGYGVLLHVYESNPNV